MHDSDWRDLLSRLPEHLRRLRRGATESRLRRVEAALHLRFPEPFRNFLRLADGGWIGDVRIYGTPELERLAEPAPTKIRIGATGREQLRTAWKGPKRRLLPFHPVDRFSIECLDLDREEQPIVWCNLPGRLGVGSEHGVVDSPFETVHPLARNVFHASGTEPSMNDTYVDFLDWVLDALVGVQVGSPLAVSSPS